ncbi:hypothetical protein KP509_23G023200 [Ceratopteris richardii]|nr:hypothetical protein KP509_23G023200 [Ceratopteris richardii]
MEIILYEDTADFEFEHGYSMAQVCDRLIDIFTLEKTNEMEWRKLLILSDDWYRIRDHFFKRCSYKGNNETDKVKKTSLASLSKKLEQVDADMQRHGQLLDYVKQNWPELDVIVAGRRQEFSNGFFQHMTILGDSYSSRIDKRDEIARLAAKCLAAVEAHDRALEDDEAVILAQQKFDKILDSLCLDEACSKIDELAKKKQLDSTLMLLFARAWAAANESTSMSEEMKELMHHLYLTARGHIQRLIPKEVRILQQLASIEEPTQRFKALTECFSPGDENAEKRTDIMYTKPEKLQKWLNLVLDGYHFNKQETVIESARQLMNPQLIHRLRQLQAIIEDQFM